MNPICSETESRFAFQAMTQATTDRKNDHIHINLHKDVSFDRLTSGLERYRFVHQALPDLNLDAISTETVFLDKELSFPLIISSMTGGSDHAAEINRILAQAAQEAGIGMGLGSMRAAVERPETAWTYQVREYAPDILLLANLGAVQLNYGYGPQTCQEMVEMVEADALILHLNPLQEALQPEGDIRFGDLLGQIAAVCETLNAPVIVKEVGWGLSKKAAQALIKAGVAALDVAGAGGTSWSQVEMYRSKTDVQRQVAAAFRNWGIPTAESIQMVREVNASIPLIASGGLYSGIDIAKSLALGANVGAIARPLLHSASISLEALRQHLEVLRQQFRITMFAAGACDSKALHTTELISAPR
jgi:isopentenyl-diphosphate delta-isomerase